MKTNEALIHVILSKIHLVNLTETLMEECFIILFSEEAPRTIKLVLNLDAMLLLFFFKYMFVFSGKVNVI